MIATVSQYRFHRINSTAAAVCTRTPAFVCSSFFRARVSHTTTLYTAAAPVCTIRRHDEYYKVAHFDNVHAISVMDTFDIWDFVPRNQQQLVEAVAGFRRTGRRIRGDNLYGEKTK